MSKHVYFFGAGKAEGKSAMKNLLGGKGANLAEMTNIGINVPAGFTITTEVCTLYYKNKRQYPKELRAQVDLALKKVEKIMGKKSEDTLFIGCESRVNCDQIVVSPFEDGKIIVTVGLDEKVGIGLAGNFIGFRTGKFADEVNHENKKAISNNDKKALTAGVVTGVVVYGLISCLGKK